MKTLTVGFSRRKSKWMILSTIIQLVQKSEFSHVFFKLESDNLRNALFYHASGSNVNFMGTELFYSKHQVVKEFELEIDENGFYEFLDAAIDQVGKPYSIMQLLGFLIVKLFGLKKNPFGKKGLVCTELVAIILSQTRGAKFHKDSNLIDLKDIYNFLNK